MSDFRYELVSHRDYEHLLVEVYFKEQRLFQLSKEEEGGEFRIHFLTELYMYEEKVKLEFSLPEFLEILEIAKQELALCP